MARRGRPTKQNSDVERAILNAAANGANYRKMAKAAGIDETTLIDWRKKSPEFASSIKRAVENSRPSVDEILARIRARQRDARRRRYRVD